MNATLKNDEKEFVRDLLAWDQRRRPLEWILSNLALVVAAAVFVVTCVFTAQHLTDSRILFFTVPGFVLGILFVGIYYLTEKRIKERHRIASMLNKLAGSRSHDLP